MEEQRKWIIYKHTNKINGKVYIGQTKNSITRRASGGYNYKSCRYFYNAITYYGWNNFSHEIIHDNISNQNMANDLERKYIQEYRSYDSNYGYNIDLGGRLGNVFYKPVYQYSLNGLYINTYNSLTIAEFETNIDACSIGAVCLGNRKSAGGYLWSNIKYDKLPEYYLKTKTKPIFQYDCNGNFVLEYKNAFEAGTQFGDYASHRIIEHCESEKGECFSYQWRYYKVDNIGNINDNGGRCKTVYQYDANGNMINSFQSAVIAAKKYNVDRHAISSACRNKNKKSCGYYWSYDYMPNYLID